MDETQMNPLAFAAAFLFVTTGALAWAVVGRLAEADALIDAILEEGE